MREAVVLAGVAGVAGQVVASGLGGTAAAAAAGAGDPPMALVVPCPLNKKELLPRQAGVVTFGTVLGADICC
jgi:hypothetical protein